MQHKQRKNLAKIRYLIISSFPSYRSVPKTFSYSTTTTMRNIHQILTTRLYVGVWMYVRMYEYQYISC